MQRGFTLLELIFVIVILGALAGIATSKFMVSRDDAKIVVAATNIKTLITRLNEYYNTQGKLDTSKTIAEMTGVIVPIKINNDNCLVVNNIQNSFVSVELKSEGDCKELWEIDSLEQIKNQIQNIDNNQIKVGGSKIKF